jgi:predicted nucleic acid-binding protein
MAIRRITLDTNAYAAFKRGVPEAAEIIRHVPLIGISSVVLGELLAGFAAGTRETENRRELERFIASDRVQLLAVDQVTAGYYATVYQKLRRKGRPISTNDMWLAATALEHSLAVFSYDEHFESVDDVVSGTNLMDFVFRGG